MIDYKRCRVCGICHSEEHHIIFRSAASWMVNVQINKIYLCVEHHRGNDGPHKSRQVDLKYKRMLQEKLSSLFIKEHYTIAEIKTILEISEKEAEKIVNKLKLYKEGYSKEDIIRKCMGGRLY